MAKKRSLDDEKINIDSIFESLSSRFEATYSELLNMLKKEPKFKHLKRIGEKQFYETNLESNIEMESQNTRLCYAEMNLMIEEVQKTVETIISNKFQGSFLGILKEEVLNTILELYSEQKHGIEESSKNDMVLPQAGSSAMNQKCTGTVSGNNLNDVGNKVIDVIDLSDTEKAEKILSRKNKVIEDLDTNNSKSDDGNATIGSFSSVHTSDLSSFDDSLVLSSDEEIGLKRKRMSMEAAGERLSELKLKKSAKKSKENQHEDTSKLKNPLNESSSVSQKTSSRVRKPNSKYITDEIVSPLKKATEKFSTSTPASKVDNSLPRKRGRPKKH